jgi:hypothetical protein
MSARKPRKDPAQPALDGLAEVYKKRATERAAEADLRDLRKAGQMAVATSALATAYRLVAREVDRAETEEDRWGKMKAASELRAIRVQLAPMTALTTSEEADGFWSDMSTPAAGDI